MSVNSEQFIIDETTSKPDSCHFLMQHHYHYFNLAQKNMDSWCQENSIIEEDQQSHATLKDFENILMNENSECNSRKFHENEDEEPVRNKITLGER